MPMYEYVCRACSGKFEKLVKSMSSTEPVACPSCKSTKTARELSVFAVASASGESSVSHNPPGCGRCGGPGPCGG